MMWIPLSTIRIWCASKARLGFSKGTTSKATVSDSGRHNTFLSQVLGGCHPWSGVTRRQHGVVLHPPLGPPARVKQHHVTFLDTAGHPLTGQGVLDILWG